MLADSTTYIRALSIHNFVCCSVAIHK